jgi:hypothetical protein
MSFRVDKERLIRWILMKFRHHRGSLKESMATVVEVANRQELAAEINREPMFTEVSPEDIYFAYQSFDERTKWKTYLVLARGYPVGYSDSAF